MSFKHPLLAFLMLLPFVATGCGWQEERASIDPGKVRVKSDCPDSTPIGETELLRSQGHDGYVLLASESFGLPDANIIEVRRNLFQVSAGDVVCSAHIYEKAAKQLAFFCRNNSQLWCIVSIDRI